MCVHTHESVQIYKNFLKKNNRNGILNTQNVFLRLKGIKAVVSFDEYACQKAVFWTIWRFVANDTAFRCRRNGISSPTIPRVAVGTCTRK